MGRPKRMFTCDAETDPFLHGRIPFPFIWGLYDGKRFATFDKTEDFVHAVYNLDIILYAHNGGKFDFMYLLPFIHQTKAQIINGRIVSMFLGRCELRDSFSIIPEPLRNFGDKREIDYSHLELAVRDQYKEEIHEYLYYDCKILYDACKAYRLMAGTKKTIASNALAYSKKLGIDPGKTNSHFDKNFRHFYYGGRTECFAPGTHHNIKILDIHSAYPFAMSHNHANARTLDDFDRGERLEDLSTEQIQRAFIKIECFSHGAFPKRISGPNGGLSFPHEYDEYSITGWEYLVAKEFGLFDHEKIISVRTCQKTINFSDYVEHWYAKKAATNKKTDPINYTIAKIMMNSLYGKLAQNICKYYDYKIEQGGTAICEFEPSLDPAICKLCGLGDKDHGWELATEFGHHEIHRRSSLYKYKLKYGQEWEARSLFNNVATGASVTGFTRAHLLRAICTVGMENIIYCDTDSIICKNNTDISGLCVGEGLGEWEIEDQCAPIGHFAGKKLYGIRTSQFDKAGKPVFKIASKGSKLDYDKLERIVVGDTVQWKSPAPSFSVTSGKTPLFEQASISDYEQFDNSKLFVVRNIRRTAQVG
jgi:DNA polymerase type B, organellar and viral